MTNRKNHNSIIFLTTLSVYLGLVLVGGAAPSVFAQAATTRQFDIKNEIEVKDDLDKKPDDKDSIDFAGVLESYFKDAGNFLEDLQKLQKIDKFGLSYDAFDLSELGFTPCKVNGDPVHHAEVNSKIDNRWLEPAIIDAQYALANRNFLSDCLKNDKFEPVLTTGTRLKLSYDKKELKIEVSAFRSSPQRAEFIAGRLAQAIKLYKVDEDEINVQKIYENTQFSSENNQILIVTRLPRASIDELPAKDAR